MGHSLQRLFLELDFSVLRDALLRAAAVLLCLTVHETCHGLAAYALGDPTARDRHRLSLNPLRHIDWLGLALMFLAGFGWAKPVPVDPRYFRRPKQGMALTALAGPASNFLLALLAVGLSRAVYQYMPYSEGSALLFNFLLYVLAPLSIGLGLFNLLPIPPLDGAKVLGALLPDRTYFGLMRYERYGMLLLLALSYLGVTGGLVSGAIYRVFEFILELFY
ncbi:MAG: site-2 protease family protein [Oscillibacter sp.]|nr:site-2 protease family protein [Oscillibacter sp.]